MGEIAEAMLDGTLCAGCGVFLGIGDDNFEPDGIPGYCSEQCARDHGAGYLFDEPAPRRRMKPKKSKTHQCPKCSRLCRGEEGLRMHVEMKHGEAEC